MPKPRRLIESFQPSSYELNLRLDGDLALGQLKILGHKTGRPSHRLTFHQKDLKVTSAKLIKVDKKGSRPIEVARINPHQSFEEIRLHTSELLHRGSYEVDLEFSAKASPEIKKQLEKLRGGATLTQSYRHIFPLIDEPETKAVYNITSQDD